MSINTSSSAKEVMHELCPLAVEKVNNEMCAQPQFVNIVRWLPQVLVRHQQSIRPVSGL